jgi:hypothetical protein
MAVPTRTLHGTRSILQASVSGTQQGKMQPLGMFETIETGVSQDHFEPYILGRASPGEVVLMGQAPIMVRLSGYRKIDATSKEFGPYGNQNLQMNKLQELVGAFGTSTGDVKDLTIQVVDRQSGFTVLLVKNCKVVSHNFSVAAKQPARLNLELVGMVYEDETGTQSEGGTEY